jgi:hypothetical protein
VILLEQLTHLVAMYKRQEPYDSGELTERQVENLRPQGNVTKRPGDASTPPAMTPKGT